MSRPSPERDLWASVLLSVFKDLEDSRGVLLLYEGDLRLAQEMLHGTQAERRQRHDKRLSVRNNYQKALHRLIGIRKFRDGSDSIFPLICNWVELEYENVHEMLKRKDSGWLPKNVREDLERLSPKGAEPVKSAA